MDEFMSDHKYEPWKAKIVIDPAGIPKRHCAAYFTGTTDHQPHPWFVSHDAFWCPGNWPTVTWPDKCPRCGFSRTGIDVSTDAPPATVEWCHHEFHA